MKKGLRGILIAVAAVFGLLMVMSVLGNTVFSDAEPEPAPEQAELPSQEVTATTTGTAGTSSKNSVLLFRFPYQGSKDIGGLMFEDGTYVVVGNPKGKYVQTSINKAGTCFAFFLDEAGYFSCRTEVVELEPGMVVYCEAYESNFSNFYVYREHVMPGVSIIVDPENWGINYFEKYKVTVRTGDAVADFSITGKLGRDKIIKIPLDGAKSIIATLNDGHTATAMDSFDNPVPVQVSEPYTLVRVPNEILSEDMSKWIIVPPVVQEKEIKLSDATIQEILKLRP